MRAWPIISTRTRTYVAGKLTEVFSKYDKVDHIIINIKHSKTMMQSHAERIMQDMGLDSTKQSPKKKKKKKRATAFVNFRGNDGVKNCLALGAP
eukprot:COSAG05_NODE_406_length_10149_cov_13.684478_2_plen_94_part_00